MIRWTRSTTIAILLLFMHSGNAQDRFAPTPDVSEIDSSLIGVRLENVLKILNVDSGWSIISEPPGILRGTWIEVNSSYQIQLLVKRTAHFPEHKSASYEAYKAEQFDAIRNKKVIGVSWTNDGRCRSVGEFIPHFAFDRLGDCD